MADKWRVFGVMLVAVVSAAIGEALASKGMKQTDAGQRLWSQLGTAVTSWHVISGTLLMGLYVLLYVYTLGMTDLSYALPLSSSSYLMGALLSRFYLHEDVKPARWIGTPIIIAGVLVVALFGSGGGPSKK